MEVRKATEESWGARLLGLGNQRLVLASSSPRRANLLRALEVPFTVRPATIDERWEPGEAPQTGCVRLARAKARAAGPGGEDELVVGADTVVVLDGDVLGKPVDGVQAGAMLRRLSGRAHEVLTALALVRGRDGAEFTGLEITRVRFGPLSPDEVEILAGSGEAQDKAGAYAIQGLAGLVIESIEGDYYNVVGLPLARLRRLIQEARWA